MGSGRHWGKIIDERDAERFVGREREQVTFRREINLTPANYFIFYINGQGGVGKSTLLNRYRDIARESGFVLADCDERQRNVPAVLGRFAHQLAEQGFPLKHFDERYKTYRQKMNEIENDPEAPQGLAAILGRTMVRAAFIGGDLVPVLGKGLELLPRESLETQASEWASYLARKLTSKDEVALIREPVAILTPLFFKDLNEIAQKRKALLCFENFEVTRQDLQEWLLHLLEYEPSEDIRIVIVGRDQPGSNWDNLRNVTMTIRLDVFTEQEANTFLDKYRITDPKRRTEIIECSGRLPVIMSWLAAPESNEPDISIPTHNIVERFLRWINDPHLRQVALLGAIPRTFNLDILKLLLQKMNQTSGEEGAFEWLLTMPFVKQYADGWRYHEVVRRMMLYYQRQKSPQTYRQMHTVLADFYNTNRHELSPSEEELWTNEQWRKNTLAYSYHYLVADPGKHWGEVMSLFALAVRKRRIFAVEMIDLLSLSDVQDELFPEQNAVVQLFRQQLQAMSDGSLQDGFAMFDNLCKLDALSSQAKGHMLAYRGECYRLKENWEKALSDFNLALQLIPEDVRAITRRSVTFISMERYEEALVDLNRAITLDEQDVWAIAVRGEAYRRMGRFQDALKDFNRAIALDEKHSWAIAMRGETYRQMGNYQEALRDFDSAIALDEKYTWTISRRDETLQQMKLSQERSANWRDRTNLPDPTTQKSNQPDAAIPAPNIPTWSHPQQQSIPYIPVTPMASSTEHDTPPIPVQPGGSLISTPYGQHSNIPPIPVIPPAITPKSYRSSRRFTLSLVFALVIVLLLVGLIIILGHFHIP